MRIVTVMAIGGSSIENSFVGQASPPIHKLLWLRERSQAGESQARYVPCSFVAPPLRVTLKDLDGIAHRVEVQASTLFEAEATTVAVFRHQGWAVDAITSNAMLHIEEQLPSNSHDVPLKAIERWLRKPNVSPKDEVAKRAVSANPAVADRFGRK